ncbi:MAG: diguanylate cyclase [Proteobacteria bacterium]|nr:diguanylate cyclase [Pseudomonadota bacterium]
MIETEKINILLVDDRLENLLAMESVLESPSLHIEKVTSGNDALSLMIVREFAVVLLDVQMPDMDGFETADLMKRHDKSKHTPIIFVTAISKEHQYVLQGYDSGAVDYLFKPIDPDILTSKVNVFIELYKQKKSLEKTSQKLALTVDELEKANRKLIAQQNSLIEEERLKVLLQMAGATAHELNQPLTILLSHLELLESEPNDEDQRSEDLAAIKDAGHHIADIVKRMQATNLKNIKPSHLNAPGITLDRNVHILVVEDSDADYNALHGCLSGENKVTLSRAFSIETAFQSLEKEQHNLIFLDYILPDGNALEFLRTMDRKGNDTPVVVITGQGDEMIASSLIQAGVYDYLPKNRINHESVLRIIIHTLEKVRLKEEIRESQAMIAEMSTKDPLTNLFNRRYFVDALDRAIVGANRYKNDLVLCMMDLDHFKKVNDTYGHVAGDMVLTETGKMLMECFRESDLACRYGGEELAVILPSAVPQNALAVCERFREEVASHVFEFEGARFHVTVSIGIAPYQSLKTPPTVSHLVDAADKALYKAKVAGRNQVRVYSE